jgi:hypothetical protein
VHACLSDANDDQIVLIEAPIDRRGGLFLSICDSFAIRFAFRVFFLDFIILLISVLFSSFNDQCTKRLTQTLTS